MEDLGGAGDGEIAATGPPDLSQGVIVVLSGGPFDFMNPVEVRDRMDQLILEINADPYVLANTQERGLTFRLIKDQPHNYIHQSQWQEICESQGLLAASSLVLIGHSNGGAAAIDIARYLLSQGKSVDFVFTADSVLTLNDNGDVNKVPPNVKLNLNSHSIPTISWAILPFPFGQKNRRESDGSLDGILNIGLPFEEPGAIAHRDAFYDLAGGDRTPTGSYTYDELIRDSTLAVLRGADRDAVFQLARNSLQHLANEVGIPIDIESTGFAMTLEPEGVGVQTRSSRLRDASVADMHRSMADLEKVRLSAH